MRLKPSESGSREAGWMSGHITPRYTGGGSRIGSTPLRPCYRGGSWFESNATHHGCLEISRYWPPGVVWRAVSDQPVPVVIAAPPAATICCLARSEGKPNSDLLAKTAAVDLGQANFDTCSAS